MRTFSLLALTILTACGSVTEDNFTEKGLDLLCDRSQECDDGLEDFFCEMEETTSSSSTSSAETSCEFDSKAAKDCLKEIKKASCDDYLKASEEGQCTKVWECSVD